MHSKKQKPRATKQSRASEPASLAGRGAGEGGSHGARVGAGADALAPSDLIASASDELGGALAAIRAQALDASGPEREALFDLYDQLLRRQRKLVMRDLKAIDGDPDIQDAVGTLTTLTQQIAEAKREMTTAAQTVERATKVLGFVDQFLGILGKVGVLA